MGLNEIALDEALKMIKYLIKELEELKKRVAELESSTTK